MNIKLWNYFQQTAEYTELVDLFDPSTDRSCEILEFAQRKGWIDSATDEFNLLEILSSRIKGEGLVPEEPTRDLYESLIDGFNLPEFGIEAKHYRHKLDWVLDLSVMLYNVNPFFKPMLVQAPFYIFENACREIGLALPVYPAARDYKGFLMLYYDMCKSLREYQDAYGLSDSEMCVCLYEFALSFAENKEKSPLPKPVNVWITGADYPEFLSSPTLWQCNAQTRRGDIILVYATSKCGKKQPYYSSIHSIWRAESESAFNPFVKYQNQTELSHGVYLTKYISKNQLEAEPRLASLPMLHNNMQGLNGKNIPAKEYEVLLEMMRDAGNDMSDIPLLCEKTSWCPPEEMETDNVTKPEKKVEEYILKPFLAHLGYTEGVNFDTQVILKMGRKESERPDFVLFPKGEMYHKTAPMLIEVKDYMANESEVRKNFSQALSYANALLANYLCICDKECIYVFQRKEDKTFDYDNPVFHFLWAEIFSRPDAHQKVVSVMSPEVLKKIQ